jgi:hypothetical protein
MKHAYSFYGGADALDPAYLYGRDAVVYPVFSYLAGAEASPLPPITSAVVFERSYVVDTVAKENSKSTPLKNWVEALIAIQYGNFDYQLRCSPESEIQLKKLVLWIPPVLRGVFHGDSITYNELNVGLNMRYDPEFHEFFPPERGALWLGSDKHCGYGEIAGHSYYYGNEGETHANAYYSSVCRVAICPPPGPGQPQPPFSSELLGRPRRWRGY